MGFISEVNKVSWLVDWYHNTLELTSFGTIEKKDRGGKRYSKAGL